MSSCLLELDECGNFGILTSYLYAVFNLIYMSLCFLKIFSIFHRLMQTLEN
jgi:hypothetical protein